jgi:hypothetical protein
MIKSREREKEGKRRKKEKGREISQTKGLRDNKEQLEVFVHGMVYAIIRNPVFMHQSAASRGNVDLVFNGSQAYRSSGHIESAQY